jgi:hypothetical protein
MIRGSKISILLQCHYLASLKRKCFEIPGDQLDPGFRFGTGLDLKTAINTIA